LVLSNPLTTLLLIPTLIHLCLGVWIVWSIRRVPAWSTSGPERKPEEIVCLVAARNEEASIDSCLRALLQQSLRVSVVVIDDDSDDRTRERAEAWIPRFAGRLSVLEGGPGKAMALSAAIESTSQPVILTTDADCSPPPDWAASMVHMLDAGGLAALAGCTMVVPSTPTGTLEAVDWSVLLATSAALSESGRPVTAMGNNMAILRSALTAVGGFRAASRSVTEDYAVFRAIGRRKKVELRMAPELLNWTAPTGSLVEVFRQRRRWARGGLDGSMINRLIVIGSVLAFASPLVLLVTAPSLGVGLILARWAVTASMVRATQKRLGVSLPAALVPLHDVLLTIYVILVPVSLIFWPRIRWKDRAAGQ
jgi:cellulose synthase/poly-beta-1,6-N-acetylglucosamine synthase-like glycosyltransferase